MAKRIIKSVKNSVGNRVALKKGECLRNDGMLVYRYTDENGNRHTISSSTIESLREKENELNIGNLKNLDASARNKSVNDVYSEWIELKRGIRWNTQYIYNWLYTQYIRDGFGKKGITNVTPADIKKLYNHMIEFKHLSLATVDNLNTVMFQVFGYAFEQRYIDRNPCVNAMDELKKAHNTGEQKHKALTMEEQKRFLDYTRDHEVYSHWYPIFAVMVGTGMRVGELSGLRWCDIDLDKGIVSVNHTLVYYQEMGVEGSKFRVNKPKTSAGKREITMLKSVKEAFEMQRKYLDSTHLKCKVSIDGYTDFVFLNKLGSVFMQQTLNRAIRVIVRDANLNAIDNGLNIILPKFTCHNLRATYCTRLAEAGVNLRVAMKLMGHSNARTTMAIYTSVNEDWEAREMENVEKLMSGLNAPDN